MDRDESRSLYGRALSALTDGVNSSVRATQPYPFFVERGDGAYVVDADGNRYVDYVVGYEPLLYGHDASELVQLAVQKHTAAGPIHDTPTEIKVEHAEFVVRHVSSVEMPRFVNSGTEATVSAVRLTRGVTGRDKIAVMQDGYHGVQESTLIEGGPGGAKSSTSGIPSSLADHTISVPLNDEETVREVFAECGGDIAAVLTEPILVNTGIVHPIDGYLEALRDMTETHGAFLISDEAITSPRVGGLQCAQGKSGITSDPTTFGKIIGDGLPVGAIGGKAELVKQLTPDNDVFQSGTSSDHPIMMATDHEYLKYAAKDDVCGHVDRLGEKFRAGITDILEGQTPEYTVAGTDSMFKAMFMRHDAAERIGACIDGCSQVESCPNYGVRPRTGADVSNTETNRRECILRQEVKDRDVSPMAGQFESQLISYAHTDKDIKKTLEAHKTAL